jgi:hypothetical protein
MIRIRSQANGDYDPSFVTEVLREIQYSNTPNQDINLLKDVAAPRRMRVSRPFYMPFPPLWLTKQYLSGSGYHCFGNRNFFPGDGLLSRGAEGGSSRT